MSARSWFHVALGAVFLPVLSLPFVWGVAIRCWGLRSGEEDTRWARRLVLLAAADTLVAATLIALAISGRPVRPDSPAASPRAVMGVTVDPSFPGPGVRLRAVTPGGPADGAGIQVGDVVRTIDGQAVDSADALRNHLGALGAGAEVEVGLTRDGAPRTIRLRTASSTSIRPPPQPLFRPAERTSRCWTSGGWRFPWRESAALGALGALGLVAILRRRGAGVLLTALAMAAAGIGTVVAWGATCLAAGGETLGGAILGLWGGSTGLGLAAFGGNALIRKPALPRTRSVPSTVRVGLWYAFTGALRLTLFLGAILPASAPGSNPIEGLVKTVGSTEGPGLLLVGLAAVVLAPIAEELAFRGLLLPSLARWLGTTPAVCISAAVFGSLHWYYGPMIPVIVFLGLVLGWARVVSGGVRAPMLIHGAYNCGLLLLLGLRSVTGR